MRDPKFPATRRLWGFLWRVPVGWCDLGILNAAGIYAATRELVPNCHICGESFYQIHLGRDSDGTLFRYCPKCLTKLDETK
jgi:hypothetical protein